MLITQPDRDRLVNLLRSTSPAKGFGNARTELLARVTAAEVVPSSTIPGTVVTMNSIVKLIDITSGAIMTCTLVFPQEADVDNHRISILAPLGVALLGQSEGEVVEFTVPAGTKQFMIHKVIYQPEERLRRIPSNHGDA